MRQLGAAPSKVAQLAARSTGGGLTPLGSLGAGASRTTRETPSQPSTVLRTTSKLQ